MTIIAGFKSWEGVVICADTQETTEHSKRSLPKLIFEPRERSHGSTDDLAAAFCGSTNVGPFVDKLILNAWESAQMASSLDEASEEIEKSIKATYREFGKIYQPGYCPSAELIYGVKMHGSSKLFNAYGPIVTEKERYHSSGVGYYMADFLTSRMRMDGLNLRQCVILAAYILFQAKEHVEGCGGDSHIAVLRDSGPSGLVDWKRVETLTEVLKESDKEIGELILKIADIQAEDGEIKEDAADAVDLLLTLRKNHIESLREHDEWDSAFNGVMGLSKEPDEFGLSKPLDSETSEPEP